MSSLIVIIVLGIEIIPSSGYITSSVELSSSLFFKIDSSSIMISAASPVSNLVTATEPDSTTTFNLAKFWKYSSPYLSANAETAANAVPDFNGSGIEIFPAKSSLLAKSSNVRARSSFLYLSGLYAKTIFNRRTGYQYPSLS